MSELNGRQVSFERIAGEFSGAEPGPLMLVTAGLHGNEPSGIFAARRVFAKLHELNVPFKGDLVVISGNIPCLELHQRFIDEDLNRVWGPGRISQLETDRLEGIDTVEAKEQLSIYDEMMKRADSARGKIIAIDLHSCSSHSMPFCFPLNNEEDIDFAKRIPTTCVLGVDDVVAGSMLQFTFSKGWLSLTFEGGNHDAPETVDSHEAFLWAALAEAGCINPSDVPGFEGHLQYLRDMRGENPSAVEIVYRHDIVDGEDFEMVPGYANFQPVTKGEVLAKNRFGEIHSNDEAMVFLPLYQKQGNDGFFLVKEKN